MRRGTESEREPADRDYVEEILIRDDGCIVIKHLTPEMARLAQALNPGDERLVRALAALAGPQP